MLKTNLTLTAVRPLTRDVYRLDFAGDTAAITRPGQFVNLALPGLFLRRPVSVCDWDAGTLTLICRAVGEGTRLLCAAPVGTVFDALTGLGNGYDIHKAAGRRPILLGGGVGLPPLYGLAKALLRRGVTPTVAMGFGSRAELFYEAEFRALGCPVLVSTVDGSYGQKGFVTQLAAETDCDYGFCCGPLPMLRAVWALPQLTGGQFSFEARMGCGFGACVGCTMETRSGPRRVCKDGPVFEKEEILW